MKLFLNSLLITAITCIFISETSKASTNNFEKSTSSVYQELSQ